VQHFLGGVACITHPFHVAIDLIAVRPIAFDGNETEAALLDELFGDLGAPRIELGCAMRSFAQQHEAGITDRF
jgi:hypothetical protein